MAPLSIYNIWKMETIMTLKFISFFSTNSVKEKITTGTLTEGQLFIYFYLIFMYDALGLTQQCISMIGKQASLIDLVNIWGYFIITGVGLLILFFANGGINGNSFVRKFFAFSFTVGYKYGIAFIILGSLSKFISASFVQMYEIIVYFIINLLMVINIAYRIYQTRDLSTLA